nr:hypothetical protein DWUX_479 [Desulfovibrio diazotrophicus]
MKNLLLEERGFGQRFVHRASAPRGCRKKRRCDNRVGTVVMLSERQSAPAAKQTRRAAVNAAFRTIPL